MSRAAAVRLCARSGDNGRETTTTAATTTTTTTDIGVLPLLGDHIVTADEPLPATWCSRTKGARWRRRTQVDHLAEEWRGTWNSRYYSR